MIFHFACMATVPKTRSASDGVSLWPSWKDNRGFALLLGILMAYGIVFLGAKIRETMFISTNVGFADRPAPSISVTATATTTVASDIATIDLGITNAASSPSVAQDDNTAKVNAMIAGLRELGVEDRDMKTSAYTVYPQYDYNQSPAVVVGYEASQTVTVRIREKDLVNSVIAKAGDLGATNIGSLRYEADDKTVAEAEARKEAIGRAYEQALSIADAMGANLGDVVSYAESDNPSYYGYAYDAASGGTPDIQPGEEDVVMTVYVDYALE
jgi:uncharacterized protein YggE